MFSFFKRKKNQPEIEAEVPSSPAPAAEPQDAAPPAMPAEAAAKPALAPEVEAGLLEQTPAIAPAPPAPESPSPTPIAPQPDASAVPPPVPDAPVAEAPVQPAAPVAPPVPVEADVAAETPPDPRAEPVPLTTAPVSAPAPAAPSKSSWLSRLKQGLSKTGQNLTTLFVGVKVDEDLFDELEVALIMADTGVEAAESLLKALRAKVREDRLEQADQVRQALRDLLAEHLRPLERRFDVNQAEPVVTMIAGVNGAGKTTSIGKLAKAFQAQNQKVLLAAGDTFRAAAREQLMEWGRRNNVTVIAQEGGDPAAVAFDAVKAGQARGMGVVMVDTAGRLPTQLHLMEEIKKVKRVIAKADAQAPHEVLLVVDGNTGQNALAQIKAFDEALGLTGLIVTKLDGTAKGGILAAVASGSHGVRPIPVYWIGVGEGIDDLQPFVASEFAEALLGGNERQPLH